MVTYGSYSFDQWGDLKDVARGSREGEGEEKRRASRFLETPTPSFEHRNQNVNFFKSLTFATV